MDVNKFVTGSEVVYFKSIARFIQDYGWYITLCTLVILITYSALRAHYIKWSEQRAVRKYELEMKRDFDLHEKLLKSRLQFQEEYRKNMKIAIEKRIKKENKILEKKHLLLHEEATEQPIQSLIQNIN